jgi:hypothetical protein
MRTVCLIDHSISRTAPGTSLGLDVGARCSFYAFVLNEENTFPERVPASYNKNKQQTYQGSKLCLTEFESV